MKTSLIIIGVLFLAACGGKEGEVAPTEEAVEAAPVDTLPLLVVQIQKCSRLYTAEYKVHKIVTHDDVKRLKGSLLGKDFDWELPLGQRKIAIPMDAKLKAYIDFAQISEKNIRREGRRITITLPDPRVEMTSTKVDQRGIKEYVNWTRSDFTDAEMTQLEAQGREAIIGSIPRLGILETARRGAARVLVPIFSQMGYEEKDITVEFRKDFTERDIKQLLDERRGGR